MSRVTDLILITFVEEEDNVQELNERLMQSEDNYQIFKDVTNFFGGNTSSQLGCYGCAYNHLSSLENLFTLIKGIKWNDPDRIMLIYQVEESERMGVWRFRD